MASKKIFPCRKNGADETLFLAYRSFHMPMNTIEKFAKIGYDTIVLFPAHTANSLGTPYSQYRPVWLWYDRYDFTPFDSMVHDALTAMPDAKFLFMIDLNSPVWLEHRNWRTCLDTFNNLGKAVHSHFWRETTNRYLEAFLQYAVSKYGDRISGCILACGATDEWYDYSNGTSSSDRRDAWRKWQKARKRPDPVDIPPESIREDCPFEGFLRDPRKNAMALEYWKFCNESIADTILDFAKRTRAIVPEKTRIGCFYGYILEKSSRTLVSCGQSLAYEKVLDSPDIDFLISPGTYTDRQMGGGSGFLITDGTARIRGKRVLHECDQRTHTYNPYLTPDITLRVDNAWPDEKSTIAGLKREGALGLIKRTHLWWFDMWGDYYQGEAVMNTLKRIRELWLRFSSRPEVNVCETLLIADPDSTYFVNENHEDTPEIYLKTRNKLSRFGAPFSVYSFNDIPEIPDFERYKFVIFPALFHLTAEKRKILKKYVLRNGRTVLWLRAPGIVADGRLDPGNCEKLTGIPYKAKGLNTKHFATWSSCYIHDYRYMTPEVLRKIAEKAGVHLYTGLETPVYAEGNLLAVHRKEGGKMSIWIPSGFTSAEELFTGRVLPVEKGLLQYDFASPDTALWELRQ